MPKKKKTPAAAYDAQAIQHLKDLEGVRMRPAMYIGDTAFSGFHHLLWEVVDNSVDEALAGHCEVVTVTLNEDGSATVADDGRGIPVDMHEDGVSSVELVMTKLHAGGKFDDKAYAVSGGLHGVGLSVVNALSEWTEVEVYREGEKHKISFARGNKAEDLEVLGKTKKQGTRVSFRPDGEIFQHEGFDYETVHNRLREMAYLMGTSGLKIILEDARTQKSETFHFPEGLVAYIKDLTKGKEALTDVIHFNKSVEHGGKDYGVEVALRYTADWHEGVYSFANNIRTADGGTHLSGFRSGLTSSLNQHIKKADLLKKGEAPSGDDYKAGLYAVISLKIPDPQFEGQTKGRLGSREATSIVQVVVNECLGGYLEENPEAGRAVIRKALLARDAREAARKQRDLVRRKGALSSGALPGKLSDCQSRDREETELFIVEGDSAGGSAKTGRDRRFQAILPLKGKILNVEKNTAHRILANQELQTMIQAIGAGIGEEFDAEKCRYGKVIIMTDADVDGSHIRTLILTFFFREMRELVEAGRIWIACPPLYQIFGKGRSKGRYLHSEDTLRRAILEKGVLGSSALLPGKRKPVEGEALANLAEALVPLEKELLGFRGDRRGVDATGYLEAVDPKKGLPMSLVVEVKKRKNHFFWTEASRKRFIKGRKGAGVWEGAESETPRESADYLAFSFNERDRVQKAFTAAQEAGMPLPGKETRFLSGKTEALATSPLQLLSEIRKVGMGKIEVQRYKGLGEMNPDQLWESTMDPDLRTMRRIVLEDAYEADRVFSMLMGDETGPRREYIEKHAHEVHNLDI
ncbi:MAG TPA: DNA gyrase subunit B [Planctomycetes bacterium]|nr:DNA gyrase subunit B [Planctomycetota bacterium]